MENNEYPTGYSPQGVALTEANLAELAAEDQPSPQEEIVQQEITENNESSPETPAAAKTEETPEQPSFLETLENEGRAAAFVPFFREQQNKDPKDFGPGENLADAMLAPVEGIGSALESILTAKERYEDMAAGEDVGGPNYKPDYDPGILPEHPMSKTMWGSFIENAFHYGTLGLITFVAGRGDLPTLATGAAVGLTSNKSQGGNMFNALHEIWPWTADAPLIGVEDNPFDIEDTDHPLFKTAKNVMIDMGIDGMLSSLLRRRHPTNQKLLEQEGRKKLNSDQQIDEQGLIDYVSVEVLDPELPALPGQGPNQPKLKPFSAYANKDVAELHQGNAVPTGTADEILTDLDRIWNEGIDKGSTDAPFTVGQEKRFVEMSGIPAEELRKMAQEVLRSEQYQRVVNDARSFGVSFREHFEPSLLRAQQILGHIEAGKSIDEVWAPILNDAPRQTGGGPSQPNLKSWSIQNVVVSDIVVSSLLKKARNHAMAAKEVMTYADAFAADGPMSHLRDSMILALSQARRTRKIISYEFRNLQQPSKKVKPSEKAAFEAEIDDIFEQVKNNVDFFFEVIKDTKNVDLYNAVVDIFSGADDIRTWMDLEAYMRRKISGGEFNGKVESGALARELHAVYVNSALNGVRTPQRALIGTAEISFYNTLSRALGANARKYFSRYGRGDGISQAAATGELVAMFESVPLASKMFIKNIRKNFSKNSVEYNNRYMEYNKKDINWDYADDFYEKHGTKTDKFKYFLAKQARALNIDGPLARAFSATSRVLGPLDDAFKYIDARKRSRSQAIREALQAAERGDISELTPEIYKQADDMYYNRLLDEEGNIDLDKDEFLKQAYEEATLTSPLEGMSEQLDRWFQQHPILAKIGLFARPGINYVGYNLKQTPLVGALIEKNFDIFTATPQNFREKLGKYGVSTVGEMQDLKNQVMGQQLISSALLGLYVYKHMMGEATGPGSIDRQARGVEQTVDRKANTVYFGKLGIPVSTLQTHQLLLELTGLVMDNANKMGPEWAENSLSKILTALGSSITGNTMLEKVSQLFDIIGGAPGASPQRLAAEIVNTQIPGGANRNDIGKFFNPYAKELNADFVSSIANRNRVIGAQIDTDADLPNKTNILNGKKIGQQPWGIQQFNAISAIPIDWGSNSDAVKLISQSNYDVRASFYSTPDEAKINLQAHPEIRALFQERMGQWRNEIGSIEDNLNALYKDPSVQNSIDYMNSQSNILVKFQARPEIFLNSTKTRKEAQQKLNLDPLDYTHNQRIKNVFDEARKAAWDSIRAENRPDVEELYQDAQSLRGKKERTREKTSVPQFIKETLGEE